HSATSALASSIDPGSRSRFGVDVWRTAFRMGYLSRRHEAVDGVRVFRVRPSQSEADAWLSRSMRSTRRLDDAGAADRFTAAGSLPTPPLLYKTAMTTDGRSGILSTNRSPGNRRLGFAVLQCERHAVYP